MNSNVFKQALTGTGIIAVLALTVWLYWPGLNGEFILDDLPNLGGLSHIDNQSYPLNHHLLFVLEGTAGRLGRPISLLTFAAQAQNWPHNPWAFKYVNLMLHLLNACLLAWMIYRLTRLMSLPERQANWLLVFATGLWLIHPIQVSSVLYVVQRMTELSALFILAESSPICTAENTVYTNATVKVSPGCPSAS